MPSTDCRSSSFAITTSTPCTSGRITRCASAAVHNFERKFRSRLTGTFAAFAASSASRVQAAADAPSAGVMPVQWNHCGAGQHA